MSSPPGWYPDPRNPGQIRYWDGAVWTEHLAPQPVQAPPPSSRIAAGVPPAPSGGSGLVWWQTWFAIVPGLILCLPVGLVWLWRRPGTPANLKWIVTASTVALLAAPLFLPDDDPNPDEPTETVASPAVTEPSADPPTETASAAPIEEPPVVKAPALRGLGLAQAKRELRRSGLVLGAITRQPSAKPAGVVLKQDVPRGTALEPGLPIALVVAAPFPRVPAVVGRSRAAAIRTLRSAGFEVQATTETRTSGTSGVVLSQTPAGATRVKPGSVVQVVISKVVPAFGGGSSGNCTPGYSPCLAPASDYDCAGGSGDGPEYVHGVVEVNGADIYDLDRDGDGFGCD
jgi:hypothetical protein